VKLRDNRTGEILDGGIYRRRHPDGRLLAMVFVWMTFKKLGRRRCFLHCGNHPGEDVARHYSVTFATTVEAMQLERLGLAQRFHSVVKP
jgi:hypothetical protein